MLGLKQVAQARDAVLAAASDTRSAMGILAGVAVLALAVAVVALIVAKGRAPRA